MKTSRTASSRNRTTGSAQAGHESKYSGRRPARRCKGKKGKEKIEIAGAAERQGPDELRRARDPGGYSPITCAWTGGREVRRNAFARADKLIAAVCHGPQLLIEADAVEDKKLTSWPSVHTDLVNAGAKWVDKEVVIDGHLITSRKPDDLPAFSKAIIDQLAQGG